MIVYEVNLSVDEAVAAAYAEWLEQHVREMLTLEGFTGATWYTVESDAPGRVAWTVHYHLRDRAALAHYLEHHAPAMRRQGTERFAGRFTADRRVLARQATFTPPDRPPRA